MLRRIIYRSFNQHGRPGVRPRYPFKKAAAAKVNKLLLHEFNVRVNNNLSTNLEELIHFKLKTYPRLRQPFVDSAVDAESTKSTETPPGPPGAVREGILIPSDVVVIRPLSMDVTRAAQSVSTCASDSSEIPSTIRGPRI